MPTAYCRVYNKRPALIIFGDTTCYLHRGGKTTPIPYDRGEMYERDLRVYRVRDRLDPHFEIANVMRCEAQRNIHQRIDVHYDISKDRPLGLMGIEMLFSLPVALVAFILWVLGVFLIPGFAEVSARIGERWDPLGSGVNPWIDPPHILPTAPATRTTDEWYGFISGS